MTSTLRVNQRVRWSNDLLVLCNPTTTRNPKPHTQKRINLKPSAKKVGQRREAKMSGSCPSKLDRGKNLPLPSRV